MQTTWRKNTILKMMFCFALVVLACSEDDSTSQRLVEGDDAAVSGTAVGATQLSGIGFFASLAECDSPGHGATYAVRMTGDLQGCLYTFVDEFECSPSGTYREIGREHFIGTYKGQPGSFWTSYKFEAKYEGCNPDGSYLGAEILGRCQHPIVPDSGEGVFEGVSGRLDMKDDIAAGNYPYRGHVRY